MLERLSRSDASRMRPDLEAAIEYLPGLASLTLWCRFADTDDADTIAYTDGSTIYAGAGYEKFEPKERRFICLHEILHVALCHAAGDSLCIEITGANGHYHHSNSMNVEIEFESETDDKDLPARLKIARPVLREELEEYLGERVKEISREPEKSGYAEIEYRSDETTIRAELSEREHPYEKDGARAMTEFEFCEWTKAECAVLPSAARKFWLTSRV